ncbi:MAG: hypothetical protein K2I07_08700 [Lachnospiraceae bacterium]|nr:hypothetical protein [Lachnospiraceae bacterium]
MSEIRKFRGKNEYIKPVRRQVDREQVSNGTEGRRKERTNDLFTKIWRHRLTVFYRVALVLIVIAAVIAICVIRYNNKVYTGYTVSSEESWTDNSSLDVLEYNGNILTYSKDGAVCTDLQGKTLWNQSYEMQNPLVTTCGDYAVIGDYNGTSVFVMNSSGQQGAIDTRMPIRAIDVSAKGTVLAILDDAPNTWFYLYSKEGKILWTCKSTMSISGYPLNASVSDNSMMVGVSYLYVDNGVVTSKVAFYNLDEVGDNYQDTLVSVFNYNNAIVPILRFMNEEDSFAVADNRLMLYSGRQIPTSTKEIILSDEMRAVFYSSKYVGLVFLNITGDTKYRLDVYNTSGDLVHTYEFDQEYKQIMFHDDFVYIYNESECMIYQVKGKLKFEGQFDIAVQLLLPTTARDKLVLVSKNRIQNIRLN